ncbi:MAG: threonylcarbamoyl-AMP synthase [Deltaproteobacteria bacterium]|nr:threonylcarbamoyl-AMP synthase [Deltaproteobacteria bacterium]HCH61596.1 threonylcarbamoyl-AMP synthase [Deltaproteobacteria bacterium]
MALLDNETLLYEAVERLRRGELVAFPTETVYGLGADARNPSAVARIFSTKGRPADHPVIVHVAEPAHVWRWARDTPELRRAVDALAERFWPGPLTIILPRDVSVDDIVTGGRNTIGLRVPAHPVARALLLRYGSGLAAPSANRFGRVSPTSAAHVREEFGSELFVLDGGSADVGVESTIVDLSGAVPAMLRLGGIPREAVESVLGPLGTSETVAPGTLPAHYAPRAGVLVSREVEADAARLLASGRSVVILWAGPPEDHARRLYAELRAADAAGADVVVAEAPHAGGLGDAIADRLARAAVGSPVSDGAE